MIPNDVLFDAYLDANILLVEAYVLWLLASGVLRLSGVVLAYRAQLWMLNGVFLTVMLSPILVALLVAAQGAGLVPQGTPVNLTDYLLALFLNGGIDMAATDFEQILVGRETFTREVARANSELGMAVAALLGLGLALFALRIGRNVLRLCRTIRSSYHWRRSGRVHLRLSDTITVPFSTRSLTRRFVVIPSDMLTDTDDLRIVLAHEFQHLRQSDIEWEIALECLRPLFFWNPAFHLWKRKIEALREYACDEEVLSRRSISVKAYSECLLHVCQNALRRNRAMHLSQPVVGFLQMHKLPFRRRSVSGLEHRIGALFERGRRSYNGVLAGGILAALVGVMGISTLAIQKPDDWSQDRLMLATVVNLERLDAINGVGR